MMLDETEEDCSLISKNLYGVFVYGIIMNYRFGEKAIMSAKCPKFVSARNKE
jgi:hypothetical protein